MPADLLLDGQGRIYVLPRLNRAKELPPAVVRTVDVLSPDGELLAAVKSPDLPITLSGSKRATSSYTAYRLTRTRMSGRWCAMCSTCRQRISVHD